MLPGCLSPLYPGDKGGNPRSSYSGRGLAVLAADFNGDGIEDLYFGNRESRDNLLLHTGASTGLLQTAPAQPDGLRLFPNPCREDGTVEYTGVSGRIASVELFTQLGHGLYDKVPDVSDSIQLAVGELPPGMYTLRVQTDNNWSIYLFVTE